MKYGIFYSHEFSPNKTHLHGRAYWLLFGWLKKALKVASGLDKRERAELKELIWAVARAGKPQTVYGKVSNVGTFLEMDILGEDTNPIDYLYESSRPGTLEGVFGYDHLCNLMIYPLLSEINSGLPLIRSLSWRRVYKKQIGLQSGSFVAWHGCNFEQEFAIFNSVTECECFKKDLCEIYTSLQSQIELHIETLYLKISKVCEKFQITNPIREIEHVPELYKLGGIRDVLMGTLFSTHMYDV
ncbi:MAG: hypothetical protein ACI83D_000653 [Planctomycetota bacterium]|jgi:hypothetical protein